MEEEEESKQIGEYISALKRRAVIIIIPFLLVLGASAIVAVVLPPIYESRALILVESQQIPGQFVQSTVTSLLDERIQIIKQRALSSSVLVRLMDKHSIFKNERDTVPQSILLDRLRESISVETVTAGTGGRRGNATIAFSIAFTSGVPRVAQAVANELVTLFLEENTRSRTEGATETANFLSSEADKLKVKVEDIEKEIAVYQEDHREAMPEVRPFLMGQLSSAKSAVTRLEEEIRAISERRAILQAQRKGLLTRKEAIQSFRDNRRARNRARGRNSTDGGNTGLSPDEERLEALQNQSVSLAARYGETHPDVKEIKRQITAFENKLNNDNASSDPEDELAVTKEKLTAALQKWSELHPDVVALKKRIAALELEAKNSDKDSTSKSSKDQPLPDLVEPVDDTQLIQIDAELALLPNRVDILNKRKTEQEEVVKKLSVTFDSIPQVERILIALQRKRTDILREYDKIKSSQQDALLAKSLETERKGEKFTLLDPPKLPERPEKPDRVKILLGGFALSLMLGLGAGMGVELLDKSIRGPRALELITRHPALVVIPVIETRADKFRETRNWIIVLTSGLIVIGVGTVLVHLYFKPLDLLWALVLRRFGVY